MAGSSPKARSPCSSEKSVQKQPHEIERVRPLRMPRQLRALPRAEMRVEFAPQLRAFPCAGAPSSEFPEGESPVSSPTSRCHLLDFPGAILLDCGRAFARLSCALNAPPPPHPRRTSRVPCPPADRPGARAGWSAASPPSRPDRADRRRWRTAPANPRKAPSAGRAVPSSIAPRSTRTRIQP